MSTLALGTLFVPQSPDEIRQDFLDDLVLEARKSEVVDPAVQPGTDNYVFATAVANVAWLQYGNIAQSADAVTPLNATGQNLTEWREALGLPVVEASPATGRIVVEISGTASIPADTQFFLPNGLRGKTTTTALGITTGAELDVITIDTGTKTNTPGGTTVRFVNPPLNVATNATVSKASPLRGALDFETEARTRDRIQNRLTNLPSGGNWGHLREIALNALAQVQDCFVYPALGGPASVKIVPVRGFDLDASEFTRVLGDSALRIVRDAIQAEIGGQNAIVVQAAADQAVSFALKIKIPDSTSNGGNGSGWTDQTPWPALVGGDSGDIRISAVPANNQITLDAATTVSPVAGQTHIAWWSSNDRKFRVYLVTAVTGATTAWALTLDRPLVDSTGAAAAVGQMVCPASTNIEAYGTAWIKSMSELGPGENTADSNRLPRAKRHPFVADERPSDVTILMLTQLIDAFAEISDAQYAYSPTTTPTVPASVATAPNILIPSHFAVYPL